MGRIKGDYNHIIPFARQVKGVECGGGRLSDPAFPHVEDILRRTHGRQQPKSQIERASPSQPMSNVENSLEMGSFAVSTFSIIRMSSFSICGMRSKEICIGGEGMPTKEPKTSTPKMFSISSSSLSRAPTAFPRPTSSPMRQNSTAAFLKR